MNGLSYGCPELLEGEDGLSNAARAQKQREGAVLCEPTGSEREKKDHNTSPGPSHATTATLSTAHDGGTGEAHNRALKPVDENRGIHPLTVALKPKTDWTYIAFCCRIRGEPFYQFFQYPSVGHLHRNAYFYCWRCGSCRARLLYWDETGSQWEDGYCGQCGRLNRKPPEEYQPIIGGAGFVPEPLMLQPQVFDDEGKELKVWPPLPPRPLS